MSDFLFNRFNRPVVTCSFMLNGDKYDILGLISFNKDIANFFLKNESLVRMLCRFFFFIGTCLNMWANAYLHGLCFFGFFFSNTLYDTIK